MIKFISLILLIHFLLISCEEVKIEKEEQITKSNNFLNVKYIKNYDGDTITFNLPNCNRDIFCQNISIRVNNIDSPELKTNNQCEKDKAFFAKNFVETALSQAKRIDLKNCQRGKYFRIVCDVFYDQTDLSKVLLRYDLAYFYDGGEKKDINWCK